MMLASIFAALIQKKALAILAVALVAFIIFLIKRKYFVLSIAIAAFLCYITFAIGVQSLMTQGIIFAAATLLFSLSFLPAMINKSRDEMMIRNQKSDPWYGKKARVIETIDNMNFTGRIEMEGKEYNARAANGHIKDVDKIVTIVSRDRDTLLVI